MNDAASRPVGPTDLYHVGIVTPDLEAGMVRFSQLLGIRWGPVFEVDTDVRTADGEVRTVTMRLSYSIDQPHLELVQEIEGTPWVCNPYSNLHHLGFWTGALEGRSAGLSSSACPLEVCGAGDATGPRSFAYHRDPLGVRVELVDDAIRGGMESLWSGLAADG